MGVPVQSIAPLEPIDLPRGRTDVPVREFNWHIQQLHDACVAQPNDLDADRALFKAIVPSLTDAEYEDLSAGEKAWIIMYVTNRLDQVKAHLKNADGAAGAASRPTASPSSPTTKSSTPSPASPARSGRTGGRSPRRRSGAPSTLSIG